MRVCSCDVSICTQDVIVSEAFRLLQESVELYQYCAACPEMSLPVIASLKHFAKHTTVRAHCTLHSITRHCLPYTAHTALHHNHTRELILHLSAEGFSAHARDCG